MTVKFRSPTGELIHVALTSGHTAVVTPEGNELPAIFHKEAIARGAEPMTGAVPAQAPVAPQFDRKQVIADAIQAALDGSEEADFTKDGKPDLRRLNARLGFQAAREEVDAIWVELTKPAG